MSGIAGHSRVVSGDGVSLAVLQAGERARPTVVLIHGYPETKEMWDSVAERLAGGLHVVTYDVRGAGQSDAPGAVAAYDFERLADDFEAVIEATAPGKTVHLVGHDWGGLQAWEFATSKRFEGRLRSLTTVAGPSLDQVAISGRSPRRMMAAWRSWYILLLLAPCGPRVMSRIVLAGGGPPGAQPTIAEDVVNGANLYRRNIPRRMARPRRGAAVHVPVQLIIPDRDRYIPLSYYDLAEEHAPYLRRLVVPGPHWLPRTEPDVVAGAIASFVEEVESEQG